MATIKDIAKTVGVSCTTVSNVIHGKPGRVSAETIIKINKAIEDLNYVPNMSARSLVSNSSKVIGVINHIVTTRDKNFMEDPFHSIFIGAIESTLRENGYYLMLRTVETSQDLNFFLRNWNVDGLILTGIYEDDFYDVLTKLNIPVVLIDSYVSNPNICNVSLEDFNGGYLATKYLIDHGHRSIAFASPFIKYKGVVSERFDGYKKALSEANIEFNKDLVFEQELDTPTAIALGKSLAKRNDFTAIFSTADILAAGIITGLKQAGKKVPDDISIIGFDDINLCNLISPALTTIHQDAHLKGKLSVNYIIDKLENKPIHQRETILPVRVVERDSVMSIS
ncbi:LacI family DNA-binding transcriptional regulator [Clostridium intestinale]|uniref:LacI family transcriptional regulator n=2 Tax=Clostridium intestinale TaxID=36845 RepID=U2NJQ6_9CLOT|nr:LacI family DNA-binding transcriptional regulator [Clostridium intestinale]ERK29071.1 LacI family transcriptional regulator [Clostridium intestinale URNW]QLY80562.1 LacI family DNA-binding transcriptional regulator [Clostridium intestinale]